MPIKKSTSPKVPVFENGIDLIQNKIIIVRGKKVMLDRDLAELYGVETKYLNRQVKRNVERFPDEFMFRLTVAEKDELVTNWHRFSSLKHSTSLPYVFTVQASIYVYGHFTFKKISLNSQRTRSKTYRA